MCRAHCYRPTVAAKWRLPAHLLLLVGRALLKAAVLLCLQEVRCSLAFRGLYTFEQIGGHYSKSHSILAAGPVTRRFLAPHPVILQIGSTVFVHGGLLPQHIEYGLERINAETRSWMLGQAGATMPAFLSGRDAVVWARDFSQGCWFLCVVQRT